MPDFAIHGRVVRGTDFQALSGVPVRLVGPAESLCRLPGAQTVPPEFQVRWTRRLTGFGGNRWECWKAHVEKEVRGITWEQFRDAALAHNPSLQEDRIFKAEQDYLLPEEVQTPPFTWTRRLTGFAGTRWECWEAHVRGQANGITWAQFRDAALIYNPQLNADGRLFRPYRSYLLPENNDAPRAYLQTVSDADGRYSFELDGEAAACELQVELDDYLRFSLPVVINGAIAQPILLQPLPSANGDQSRSGTIRSARPDYAVLPFKARRIIDRALFLLGDDGDTFDALPSALRALCYGARFVHDANHPHHKDLVCADVVSIALKAAGVDIEWPSAANPHMADYYHPDRGNPKIVEIHDPHDWQPGDVLVYGRGAPGSRAGHVNLYVGPFVGTDRSGRAYNPGDGVDVVEGSIVFRSGGATYGTGVIGVNLQRCLQARRGIYTWVRHVRLREMDELWERARSPKEEA
jgi:hypothetical protein